MTSKITRKTAEIFAGSAAAAPGGIAEFGSLQAGSEVFSTDPDVIQSLPAWSNGWGGAWASNYPALEDENAVDYVHSRQIAYVLQTGMPEYDASTPYFIGSFCSLDSLIYVSLTDNNTGNSPDSSPSDWILYEGGIPNFWADGMGDADHITATIANFGSEYVLGTRIVLQLDRNINGGADLNINGLGALAIIDRFGQTLSGGYLLHDTWVVGTIEESSFFRLDMVFTPPNFWSGNDSGSANQLTYTIPTFATTGGGSPLIPTGAVIYAKIGNTNTGATVISVNSNSNLEVKDRAGIALSGGELVAGSVYPLVYDGSVFRLMA